MFILLGIALLGILKRLPALQPAEATASSVGVPPTEEPPSPAVT